MNIGATTVRFIAPLDLVSGEHLLYSVPSGTLFSGPVYVKAELGLVELEPERYAHTGGRVILQHVPHGEVFALVEQVRRSEFKRHAVR